MARQQGQNPRPQGQGNGGGERKPPATEFRCGKIRATVWENTSDKQGKWYSVTVTRSYKDAKDQWATAQSFGRDDLLVVAEVMRLAFHWINKQLGGGQKSGDGPDNGHSPSDQDSGSDIPF